MHEILMEQLVAERHRSLQAAADAVRAEHATHHRRRPFRGPLARWRSRVARPPEPASLDLAALGETQLRHLTIVAERVALAAAGGDKENPGAAA